MRDQGPGAEAGQPPPITKVSPRVPGHPHVGMCTPWYPPPSSFPAHMHGCGMRLTSAGLPVHSRRCRPTLHPVAPVPQEPMHSTRPSPAVTCSPGTPNSPSSTQHPGRQTHTAAAAGVWGVHTQVWTSSHNARGGPPGATPTPSAMPVRSSQHVTSARWWQRPSTGGVK
jgi:hypothetical protein